MGTSLYKRVPPKENIIAKFIFIILVKLSLKFLKKTFSSVNSEQFEMRYLVHHQNEKHIGFIMLKINIMYEKATKI